MEAFSISEEIYILHRQFILGIIHSTDVLILKKQTNKHLFLLLHKKETCVYLDTECFCL